MIDDASTAHALRTLQLSEARWQAILDTARDAIICIDAAGCVTLFNAAAQTVFGYGADEVLGRNVKMLMPAPYRAEHDGYLSRYRETGDAHAIGRIREVQARRKNGEVFPIELSVSEARVADQVIYSAIIRDMTERDAMASELMAARALAQQHERLADIGAITARIVHDLGNPIAGLAMQARLLVRKAKRAPDQPASAMLAPAEHVLAEAHRLEHHIRDFLDFARQQRLQVRAIAVTPFLRQLVDLWQPVAAERDIEMALDVERALPPVHADAEKLRRVLDNLVKNAVEAIDHGPGRVELRALRRSREKLRIAVEDTGPGIPDTVHVFRLFETTKPHGSGLGLSIAREIILAHGGEIAFERRQPHGTAFYVDLPYAAHGAAR